MIAQVAHRPASFTQVTARSGSRREGSDQSRPVEGRRCTFSTKIDHAAMGSAAASKPTSAELRPPSVSRGTAQSKVSAITGKARAKATQASSPARPTSPTAAETSLFGRAAGAVAGALMTSPR